MQSQDAITLVNNIATRLIYARSRLGISQGEVGRRAGVSQGTIGNIESDARRNPRELLAIARAVGVRPEWLKTGEQPMETAATLAAALQFGQVRESSSLSEALVAHGVIHQPDKLPFLTRELIMERYEDLEGEFWFDLWDEAIGGELPKGTRTLWDAGLADAPDFGDFVLIRTPDGRVHVRVYAESLAAGWQGKTLHPDYDPIHAGEGVKVLAVFVSAKMRRSMSRR